MSKLWHIIILGCLLCFGSTPVFAQNSTSPNDTFRLAKNQFTHGQYDEAIENINTLLDPVRLDSEDDLVEARRILAIAYYLLQKRDLSATEFTKLLYLRPNYKLDPFLVAPPIIEFFEAIRKKLKPQLDPILASKAKEETAVLLNSCNTDLLASKTIRINYHYNNRALTFFPFGIGQLQNGHQAYGYTSMALQIAALTVNVVSGIIAYRSNAEYAGLLHEAAAGQTPYDTQKLNQLASTSRAMTITNLTAAGVFLLNWGASVAHANKYYQPYRMELSNEPVDQAWLQKELAP